MFLRILFYCSRLGTMKSWTGPACAALVMMSDRAVEKMNQKKESSFSLSLKRWTAIMQAYEDGGFGYHTT